jgi:hypothetical protein
MKMMKMTAITAVTTSPMRAGVLVVGEAVITAPVVRLMMRSA